MNSPLHLRFTTIIITYPLPVTTGIFPRTSEIIPTVGLRMDHTARQFQTVFPITAKSTITGTSPKNT